MPPIIGTDEDEAGLDPAQGSHGAGTYVPPSGTPVASGGGEAGFAGGGSGTGKTTSAAPTSSGSNYTNLTDYLSANQGAGQTMGQAASGVASGVSDQAKGDLGTYQADAAKDAQAATVNVDPSVMSKISNGLSVGASKAVKNADGSQTITGGAETYNGPDASASYSGPADHTQISGQTASDRNQGYGDLARLAGYGQQASGGQAGNAALLKGLYTQPSYTSGENSFDAAVLGGTSGGQAGLSQIGQTAAAGSQAGSAADSAVDKSFGDAKTTTDKTNRAYQNAIGLMKKQAASYQPQTVTVPAAPQQQIQKAAATMPLASAPTPAAPSTASQAASQTSQAGQPINSGVGGAVLNTAVRGGQAIGNAMVGGVDGTGQATDKANNSTATVGGRRVAHYADGGDVNPFAAPDDDQKGGGGGMGGLLGSAGKLAPLAMMLMKSGGPVPGKANVPGDSVRNDVVPAMLSAKEIVLPRSVTLSPDAPEKAAEFVEKVQKKKPTGYAALVELCKGGMA